MGVGISPEKLNQATGERGNKTTDVPDSSLENASRPAFLKYDGFYNRWVSQKSLLVMAQKSSPAFANLKPDTVSVRFFVLLP